MCWVGECQEGGDLDKVVCVVDGLGKGTGVVVSVQSSDNFKGNNNIDFIIRVASSPSQSEWVADMVES